ncbi:DUF6084 family protein [Pseudomonas fluorescens]|uniref:Uncharacterized protein n=1 Tax=Pseudomonas fluorescens TaxID=294 RepID=A0A5E7AWR2_PSEFL|nr:DUF6084 family protein [Pseudomonas fluorescens]VVN81017.1 hypothetical protein PS723_01090 [Pseudomonas fluorescens]
MPELTISVQGATPDKYSAAPTLNFELLIRQRGRPVPIQSIALQCQIRIETSKRHYDPAEQARLSDLFGEPSRWGQTLHNMLWTHASVVVPGFSGERSQVNLPVPCSFDFNLAATKYFHGLDQGLVPLLLLYSGSVFYRDDEGALAMDLISWNEEARYALPVEVWKQMMDLYYPNQSWLCINRQVFEALYDYKRRYGHPGFDEALLSLLTDVKRAAS